MWAVPVAAQVKPNARYQTLETAHFRVTFGPGLERLAERTADVAERTRAMLLELTVEPAGKVDLATAGGEGVTETVASGEGGTP